MEQAVQGNPLAGHAVERPPVQVVAQDNRSTDNQDKEDQDKEDPDGDASDEPPHSNHGAEESNRYGLERTVKRDRTEESRNTVEEGPLPESIKLPSPGHPSGSPAVNTGNDKADLYSPNDVGGDLVRTSTSNVTAQDHVESSGWRDVDGSRQLVDERPTVDPRPTGTFDLPPTSTPVALATPLPGDLHSSAPPPVQVTPKDEVVVAKATESKEQADQQEATHIAWADPMPTAAEPLPTMQEGTPMELDDTKPMPGSSGDHLQEQMDSRTIGPTDEITIQATKRAAPLTAFEGGSSVVKRYCRILDSSGVAVEMDCTGELMRFPPGSLNELREKCLESERARHSRIFEAEKRRLYAEQVVRWSYAHEVRLVEEEYESARRVLTVRLLQENADKQRRVDELRYKIFRDDPAGIWQHRKHEMSLRGRGDQDDHVFEEHPAAENHVEKVRQVRKRGGVLVSSEGTRGMRVELDASEVMADLEEIAGERRTTKNRRGGQK
eukprot:CAMPEP_0184689948 /NCGR_PEP_ID=MMETSP0312-20130426/30940_1 /TAXON_ID=31354 /ORGANISM="Compsopogon coeruleus, Strain SAG 36.94" /LENGTH=494 /DNA_ID=CAMNT_0027147357 /DNA_START=213 /DNA_END=1697 /DNA_ORIENTATION=+